MASKTSFPQSVDLPSNWWSASLGANGKPDLSGITVGAHKMTMGTLTGNYQYVLDARPIALTREPVLTAGSPPAIRESHTVAHVLFSSSAEGAYYYEYVSSGDPKPNIDTNGTGISCKQNLPLDLEIISLPAGALDIYIRVKADGYLSADDFMITIPAYRPQITLNPNGGAVTPTFVLTGDNGKLDMPLPTPTRSNYNFTGWYEAASGGARITADTVFNVPTTIYAQWRQNGSPTPPTPPSPPLDPFWNDYGDDINNLKDGDKLVIDMKDEEVIPAKILEELAGKDVEIILDMGDGNTWTINGQDIPARNTADLNLGLSFGGDALAALVENIDGSTDYTQLDLKHNGAFPFRVILTTKLNVVNAGFFANLYYHNDATKALEFQQATRIHADGAVSFIFDHASSYAIIVTKEGAVGKEQVGIRTLPYVYLVRNSTVTLPYESDYDLFIAKGTSGVWSTTASKTNIAHNAAGKIKAKKSGKTANMIITMGEGDSAITGQTRIYTVGSKKSVNSASIDLAKNEVFHVGDVRTLVPTWSPYNATNVIPKYASSAPAIASISEMGTITAIAPGKATIGVKIGGNTIKRNIIVKDYIAATSIKLTENGQRATELVVSVGGMEQLTAIIAPAEADQSAAWKSADPAIAIVKDGMVYGIAEGTSTVIAMSADGMQRTTCAVTITKPIVTGIRSLKDPLYVQLRQMVTIPAVIEPADAPNKGIIWTTSNPGIVTVNKDTGKIKARNPGTAIITVTSKDGGFAAQVTIKVPKSHKSLTGLTVKPTRVTLTVGQSGQIRATLKPETAANTIITYASNAPHIVSVDALGYATAVSPGTAKITVKVGKFTKTVTVNVIAP